MKTLKQKTARILSALLTLTMLLGLMPTAALAAEAAPVPNLVVSARSLAEQAGDQLTWDSLSAEPADAVTLPPVLPTQLEVEGRTVSVAWSSSRPDVLSISEFGAYVDRPAAEDVPCVLTAVLTADGRTAERTFDLVVKAEGVSPEKTSVVDYGKLLETIAAGYPASTDAWTVLDMAAYNGSNIKGESFGWSSVPAAALASAAIGEAVTGLESVSVEGDYAIYTIPYLALAYEAAGRTGAGPHAASALKEAMIASLTGLNEYSDVDCVAMVLSGLAPWYGEPAVKAAVDGAVEWLSACQNADGSFSNYGTPNAETTAMVIVGLTSLGVDPHRDARFIKTLDGKSASAVEGLLSFALADHSGFGHKGNVTFNMLATEQGFRALVSYARMEETGAAYNIYTQAGDSRSAVPAPQIQVTPAPGEDVKPAAGTVTFTLVGTGAWISAQPAQLSAETATVGQVFAQLLDKAGYTYEGLEQNYVTSITSPEGKTLASAGCGPNSGWMYTVNGQLPPVGMNDFWLKNGDRVEFRYTDDFMLDMGRPFEDVAADAWYLQAVNFVSGRGIFSGVSQTDFGPELGLTRAQAVTALCNLARGKAEKAAPFTDLTQDWYKNAVAWAVEQNITSGVGGNRFAPDAAITRQELAQLLYAYAKTRGLDVTAKAGLSRFTDADSAADWAVEALNWAVSVGILSGTEQNRLLPAETVTRAQAAAMMRNLSSVLLG